MRVVILGATGMLGSMIYSYLKNKPDFDVIGTSRKKETGMPYFEIYDGFDKSDLDLNEVDYVINCIGITKPFCHDDNIIEVQNAIYINSTFPYLLNSAAEINAFKVIQIATDCVYSGNKGKYNEEDMFDALDVYGKTKSLGEVRSKRFLNIRSSIVGPEKFKKAFLLEWFLSQSEGNAVNGFSKHLWNGITTLQFAEICERIISSGKFDDLVSISSTHHFIPNNILNKYELLCLFNKVFGKGLTVNETDTGGKTVDRTLSTKYSLLSELYQGVDMGKAFQDLEDYIKKVDFYNA